MTNALEQRQKMKARKPHFAKQDAHKRAKLTKAWRRPRGYQSKMRLGKRGYARAISAGWGSPRSVEGLARNGLRPVSVATLSQLEALDVKKECAVLVRTLGARRKEELLTKAKERKVIVLNAANIDTTLAKLREAKAVRSKARAERTKGKEQKAKKTIEQKVESKAQKPEQTEKPEQAGEAADEAQKKALEAEKQKVLTKKM
jgi:large subunit ribosomal protein L32e